MSTTLFRWLLPAAIAAATYAAVRALRALTHPRRRRAQPLAGLSDHILRDIGVGSRGTPPLRGYGDSDSSSPRS